MIKFEITESPDHEVKGTFEYFQNLITLGAKSANLTIHDPVLGNFQVMLEVVSGDALVHPLAGMEFYLLNGKRATAPRKIKAGDTVSFGGTTLRLLSFEETFPFSKKNTLNQKLQALVESNSEKLPLIEALSRLSK